MIVNGRVVDNLCNADRELEHEPVTSLYVKNDRLVYTRMSRLDHLEELTLVDCKFAQYYLDCLSSRTILRKLCLIRCGRVDTLPEHLQSLWVQDVEVGSGALAGLELSDLRTFRAFPDLKGLEPVRKVERKPSFMIGPVTPGTASESFAVFAITSTLVSEFLLPKELEQVRLTNRSGALAIPPDTIPRWLKISFRRFATDPNGEKWTWSARPPEPTCRFDPATPGLSTLMLSPDVVLVRDGAPDEGALARAPPSLKRLVLSGCYSLCGLGLTDLVLEHVYGPFTTDTVVSLSELLSLPRLETLIIDPFVRLNTDRGGLSPAPIFPALGRLTVMSRPMEPD
jgi:hypothetical protein